MGQAAQRRAASSLRRPVVARAPGFAFPIAIALATALAMSACAPAPDRAFMRVRSGADRAHAAGRHAEAAAAYEGATARTRSARNRGELLYLAAVSYDRAGDTARARRVYRRLLAENPRHGRAPRAAFELARIELEHGNRGAALAALEDVVIHYPNESVARRALSLRLDALHDQQADPLPWLVAVASALASTELDENLRYAIARELERQGRLTEAREAYIACVERHPYPQGTLFDDALFRASELDEQLGAYGRAADDLRRMLAVREHAWLVGSYERPRYAPARLRLARLYRDRLHDHAAARAELHRLYAEQTTSLLRDDALWEEAWLARDDGDLTTACALARILVSELTSSRYASCTAAICATQPPAPGSCHPYVLRDHP